MKMYSHPEDSISRHVDVTITLPTIPFGLNDAWLAIQPFSLDSYMLLTHNLVQIRKSCVAYQLLSRFTEYLVGYTIVGDWFANFMLRMINIKQCDVMGKRAPLLHDYLHDYHKCPLADAEDLVTGCRSPA